MTNYSIERLPGEPIIVGIFHETFSLKEDVDPYIREVQSLFDEEFPGTEFPSEFRKRVIQDHWDSEGGYCPSCGRSSLRKMDLSVDHIVPIRHGGRNSSSNSQVLCGSCNSSKSDRYGLSEAILGRGGAKPRRRRR